MKKYLIGLVVLCLSLTVLFAAKGFGVPIPESGSGLEVTEVNSIKIIVENIEANKIGLTKEDVITKCEAKARQFRIKPTIGEYGVDNLYVNINIFNNAFNISLEFKRGVTYTVGKKTYFKSAITWNDGCTGTHGENKDFVLQTLDKYLEDFFNEYLKANGL